MHGYIGCDHMISSSKISGGKQASPLCMHTHACTHISAYLGLSTINNTMIPQPRAVAKVKDAARRFTTAATAMPGRPAGGYKYYDVAFPIYMSAADDYIEWVAFFLSRRSKAQRQRDRQELLSLLGDLLHLCPIILHAKACKLSDSTLSNTQVAWVDAIIDLGGDYLDAIVKWIREGDYRARTLEENSFLGHVASAERFLVHMEQFYASDIESDIDHSESDDDEDASYNTQRYWEDYADHIGRDMIDHSESDDDDDASYNTQRYWEDYADHIGL